MLEMINKIISIIILSCILMTSASSCSSDSVSMSYSPEQAVNDFYQSINNKDCEKNISLRSSNDQLIAGKDHDDSVKACQKLIYDGAPTVTASNIQEVSNKGGRAEVTYQLTFKSPKINKTHNVITFLIVENGEWKIDEIDSTRAN